MKHFLLFAFTFQFICSICCPALAENEAPKLTPAAQRVVYDAQQAMEKKKFLKAEKCLKKYISKYPQKPHYLVEFILGNVFALQAKEREALSHYETSAGLYPDYAAVWQNMGKIFFDLKEFEQAGDCLLKAYETNEKQDPSALYNVAGSYIMAGKEKKALPYLERLLSGKAAPPKTEWLEALLKVYMDLQLKEKAFEVIHRLLENNGNDPRWCKFLAQFYLQQSDYKNAVAVLTIHSYLTSVNLKDLGLLGDLNSVIGVPQKAAEYYKSALTLENSPANYEKLALAYIVAHKSAKAIEVLESALDKEPTSGLFFLMGQALYEEGNFDRAYDAFNHSVQHDPKNGQAYLMMGYCALQADKKNAARSAFKKACRFPRQKKTAKKLLKQVTNQIVSMQRRKNDKGGKESQK